MHWRILPLMMLFVALAHFNRISMSVAGAGQIIPSGLLSAQEMGWVYSAYLIPYTLCMLGGGWVIDRFGPKAAWTIQGFGSVVFVALTGVVGLAWTAPLALWLALLSVRGLLGVVSVPLHPTAARLVGNWASRPAVNFANGMITGAACVGMAFTYVLFGKLMDACGWPYAFVICAAITLVVAVLWSTIAADHPPGTKEAPGKTFDAPRRPPSLGELLRHRSLLYLTLAYGALGYFQYLFFYWAEYYFLKERRLSEDTSRAYASALTLAMGLGMVLGGWLTDRTRARLGLAAVPIGGFILAAAAVGGALLATGPNSDEIVLACLAVAMAGAGASEGAFWTASVEMGGRRGGSAAALLNTGGNGIGLLAPVLTPYVSAKLGWSAAVGLAIVVSLAAAALWWAVDPTDRLDDQATAKA